MLGEKKNASTVKLFSFLPSLRGMDEMGNPSGEVAKTGVIAITFILKKKIGIPFHLKNHIYDACTSTISPYLL